MDGNKQTLSDQPCCGRKVPDQFGPTAIDLPPMSQWAFVGVDADFALSLAGARCLDLANFALPLRLHERGLRLAIKMLRGDVTQIFTPDKTDDSGVPYNFTPYLMASLIYPSDRAPWDLMCVKVAKRLARFTQVPTCPRVVTIKVGPCWTCLTIILSSIEAGSLTHHKFVVKPVEMDKFIVCQTLRPDRQPYGVLDVARSLALRKAETE